MADLMAVVREWEANRRKRLAKPEPSGCNPPWPSYNGGKLFVCEKCGTRFDTSVGFARHSVYGCASQPEPFQTPKPLPSCSKCGSYYLYKGECQRCEPDPGSALV